MSWVVDWKVKVTAKQQAPVEGTGFDSGSAYLPEMDLGQIAYIFLTSVSSSVKWG